jgi:hypothetical protein
MNTLRTDDPYEYWVTRLMIAALIGAVLGAVEVACFVLVDNIRHGYRPGFELGFGACIGILIGCPSALAASAIAKDASLAVLLPVSFAISTIIALVGAGFVDGLACPLALGVFFAPSVLFAIRRPKRTDLACPDCGYSLLSLTQMRCPECGRNFSFEELNTSPDELHYGEAQWNDDEGK